MSTRNGRRFRRSTTTTETDTATTEFDDDINEAFITGDVSSLTKDTQDLLTDLDGQLMAGSGDDDAENEDEEEEEEEEEESGDDQATDDMSEKTLAKHELRKKMKAREEYEASIPVLKNTQLAKGCITLVDFTKNVKPGGKRPRSRVSTHFKELVVDVEQVSVMKLNDPKAYEFIMEDKDKESDPDKMRPLVFECNTCHEMKK